MKHLIFVIILLSSCSDNEGSQNDINSIKTIGAYNDGRETGLWQYFNQSNKLLEEGHFNSGVRMGTWKYYLPMPDSITWNRFESSSHRIITNIPEFFRLIDDEDNLVFFKYYDTTRIFNLVISKGQITGINSFDNYQRQLYQDLQNRNIKIIDTTSQHIQTKFGQEYSYDKVLVKLPASDSIIIFNIAKIDANSEITEISLRCEKLYAYRAQKTFFSIVPNLFIDSRRFVDNQDIIMKIK